jgi:5'(3')-deoxyribonucleotidase
MTRKQTINVGIDIDGVLRNFGFRFAQYAKQAYGIQVQPEDYLTWGFPNVRKPDGKKVIVDVFANPEVGRFVYEQAPPITGAYTGYRRFTDHLRVNTFVVSSQKKGYEPFSDTWLETNGFTHHIETFYEANKLRAPVQVLIDDKTDHIEAFLGNQRDAILINQPYNQNLDLPLSVERADDLIDAWKVFEQKYRKYL